jgi:hypothetical protein
MARMVASTETRAVTKITGLRTRPRGSSLAKAWTTAALRMTGSNRPISAEGDLLMG